MIFGFFILFAPTSFLWASPLEHTTFYFQSFRMKRIHDVYAKIDNGSITLKRSKIEFTIISKPSKAYLRSLYQLPTSHNLSFSLPRKKFRDLWLPNYFIFSISGVYKQ